MGRIIPYRNRPISDAPGDTGPAPRMTTPGWAPRRDISTRVPSPVAANPSRPGRPNINRPPAALPFDSLAEDQKQNALFNRNAALRRLAEMQQGISGDYTERARGVNESRQPAFSRILNNYAGRGMLHSSGYAERVGDTERNFANALANLQRQRDEGLSGVSRQTNDVEEGYNRELAEIQNAAARRLAEQAQAGQPIGLAPVELSRPIALPTPQPVAAPIPSTSTGESEQVRLERMAREILGGSRDFNNVRQSVDRLAGLPAGAYGPVAGDAQYMDSPERVMERLRAIFGNRNVPIGR